MRVLYDLGSGRVTGTSPYPYTDTADFPDQPSVLPGMAFIEYLHVEIAASPGRYRVTGPPGQRVLSDTGVPIASEVIEVSTGSASPGQALTILAVFG